MLIFFKLRKFRAELRYRANFLALAPLRHTTIYLSNLHLEALSITLSTLSLRNDPASFHINSKNSRLRSASCLLRFGSYCTTNFNLSPSNYKHNLNSFLFLIEGFGRKPKKNKVKKILNYRNFLNPVSSYKSIKSIDKRKGEKQAFLT